MPYFLHSLATALGFIGLVFVLILLCGILHADKQALYVALGMMTEAEVTGVLNG